MLTVVWSWPCLCEVGHVASVRHLITKRACAVYTLTLGRERTAMHPSEDKPMTTKQNANVSIADEQLDKIAGGQAGATPLTVSGHPRARIPMR